MLLRHGWIYREMYLQKKYRVYWYEQRAWPDIYNVFNSSLADRRCPREKGIVHVGHHLPPIPADSTVATTAFFW